MSRQPGFSLLISNQKHVFCWLVIGDLLFSCYWSIYVKKSRCRRFMFYWKVCYQFYAVYTLFSCGSLYQGEAQGDLPKGKKNTLEKRNFEKYIYFFLLRNCFAYFTRLRQGDENPDDCTQSHRIIRRIGTLERSCWDLVEFRRKLHIDLNERLLLVVFHVSWCICLWRSFFPNNFPILWLFFS